jgi:transposase-like protein
MDARTRLGRVRLYEEAGDAGLVCRRCGISRPTLRKWWRRHRAGGEAGLRDRGKRPRTSPGRKVLAEQEGLILRLRRGRKLGIKMLRNELARRHGLRLALDTIHTVLVRHGENRLARPRPKRKGTKRYSRPVPPGRPRAAGHLQDRAQPVPAHRHRPLLALAGARPLPGPDGREHPGVPRPGGRRDALPAAAGADRPRRRVPTAAASSSPTRSKTACATGASSSAPSGPARRTSTARSSAPSAPRSRSSGLRRTWRTRSSPSSSRRGGPSTTGTARTAPSAAGRRRSGSRS